MWIARDADGQLYAYFEKVKRGSTEMGTGMWIHASPNFLHKCILRLRKESYSEVTWHDEPKWTRWIEDINVKGVLH